MRIIGGAFKGRILKTPSGSSTRPTQGMLREAVFNICQQEIGKARFLDLFSGTGAMALEALSRGASQVTLVEHNRIALLSIRENIQALQVEAQTRVIPIPATRALAMLRRESAQFEIIYLDPPYEMTLPLDIIIPLLAPHGLLFLEERYEPGKKSPLFSPPLIHQSTRRFGIAQLSIFQKDLGGRTPPKSE